jgi:hypothetical protein
MSLSAQDGRGVCFTFAFSIRLIKGWYEFFLGHDNPSIFLRSHLMQSLNGVHLEASCY